MFVFNCVTDKSEILHFAPKRDKKKKKRKNFADDLTPKNSPQPLILTDEPISEDLLKTENDFHPVKCSICNTKIAVIDKEEVYHFFNVLSSY